MESITIKVDEALGKEIDKAMKPGYSTKTEFIREAIRKQIWEIEKKRALRNLEKYRGYFKGKAKMSDEEAREAVGKEIAAKYDIKLD